MNTAEIHENQPPRIGRLYGRYSSNPQERGDSKRRQIDEGKAYALRVRMDIAKEYFDEGVSGKAGANLEKQLGQLLKDAKAGECIVVESTDRLGRQNPFLLGGIIHDAVVNRGLEIHFYTLNLVVNETTIKDLGTQFGVFTSAALGNRENEQKKQRTNKALLNAVNSAKQGKATQTLIRVAPECFGWDDTKKKIFHKPSADTIKDIFRWYVEGLGRRSICIRLNGSKTPTPYKIGKKTRGGVKRWHETTIARILANEAYAGVITINGQRFDILPPVVSKETFEKVQNMIIRNGNRHGHTSEEYRCNNLFTGIGHCTCGATLKVSKTETSKDKVAYYYRCQGSMVGSCQHNEGFRADLFEATFFANYFGNPDHLLTKESMEIKERISALETRIQNHAKAMGNLLDLVEAGDKDAKTRYNARKLEKETAERELMLAKSQHSQQRDMPTAMKAVADLFKAGFIKMPTLPEHTLKKIQSVLGDNEQRRAIAKALPNVFGGVIFDFGKRTIQPTTCQSKTLPPISVPKR
ncbi:MAG: recombinase family protein [Verrucomicrobia bacterium]|nr:recombinase family protein [Verrucomicrobiota bacterium]